MKRISVALMFSAIFAGLSCSSTPAPEGDAVCDNLDESTCLFPFPSDHFRKAGGPYGQAFSLNFGDKMPRNESTDERMDPNAFADHDGFPIVPQIAFHIDNATLAGAAPLENIDASIAADSRTVIIDAETGELQPHWTEFEYLAQDQGKNVIELRLPKALKHGKRYIVAVRGLVDPAGQVVGASRGFRALRDKSSTNLRGIDERRTHFENDIFPITLKAGLARESLQLAWDFTTISEDSSTLRLRTMRDKLYDLIGQDGPEYSIKEVQTVTDDPYIDTILVGEAKVPSFLQDGRPSALRRIRLDANGLPVAQGFETVPFRVQIPKTTHTATTKASVVQYGHGFLGGDDEADSGWLRKFASERNFLILSCNMQGMDAGAGLLWFLTLPRDVTNIAYIGDEPLQGAINHLALQRLVKGRLLREANLQKDGAPIYAPENLFYHGNSQGGTQGAVVTSMSRDITRATLGVPGVSIGFLFIRANQWKKLASTLTVNYTNAYDFSSIMSLVGVGWDRGDGINFAPYLSNTPPADGTPKNVLLHIGLEDAQVNNDVSRLLARLANAKILSPATKPVWGLPVVDGPVTHENVYVDFDYGVAPRKETNRPCSDATDTHEFPRRTPEAQEQTWHFFQTGEIKHMCNGPCVVPKPQ